MSSDAALRKILGPVPPIRVRPLLAGVRNGTTKTIFLLYEEVKDWTPLNDMEFWDSSTGVEIQL